MAITANWNNSARVYSSNFLGQILKPLIVIGSSDQTAQNKFTYRITVELNGTQVYRGQYPANDSADVLADISNIIEAECEPELRENTTPLHRLPFTGNEIYNPNFGKAVKWIDVTITEFYAVSATTTPGPELSATLSGLIIWSHNKWTLINGIDLGDYKPNNVANGFLTDMPTTIYAGRDEDMTIAYVNDSTALDATTASTQLRVALSNGSVVSVNNPTYTPTTPSEANRANFILHAGVGPANIERTSINIPASVTYYDIYFDSGSGSKRSKTYRINLVDYCSTVYRLMFVNRYGFWDYFTFEKGYQINTSVTRSEYMQTPGDYTGTSFSYFQYERGKGQDVTSKSRKYKVTSRYLTTEESEWLEQLVYSPAVFWIDGATINPVQITNSNYNVRTQRYDGLFNLTIDFELSHAQWT